MSQYRIFPEQLTKKNVDNLHALPLNYVKYLIGFACARTEGFNIVTVQMRFTSTEPWTIIWANEPSHQGRQQMC